MPDYQIPNNPFQSMQIQVPAAGPSFQQAVDEYKPIGAKEMLDFAMTKDKLDSQKEMNRLFFMENSEKQTAKSKAGNMLQQLSQIGGGNPQNMLMAMGKMPVKDNTDLMAQGMVMNHLKGLIDAQMSGPLHEAKMAHDRKVGSTANMGPQWNQAFSVLKQEYLDAGINEDPKPQDVARRMQKLAGEMTGEKAKNSVSFKLKDLVELTPEQVKMNADQIVNGQKTYDQFLQEQRTMGPLGMMNKQKVNEYLYKNYPDFSTRLAAMENKANESALKDLTKRENLVNTFVTRIDKQTDEVLIPRLKKWGLTDPRFLNIPVNELSRIMGSGQLAALKLDVNSLQQEIGKVEYNALGIQQLTDAASKRMDEIFDVNMSVKDLLDVFDEVKKLGKTAMSSIREQKTTLKEDIFKLYGQKPGSKGGSSGTPQERQAQYSPIVDKYFAEKDRPMARRIVFEESRWDPGIVNDTLNKDKTKDYGLFQINDVNIPELINKGIIPNKEALFDPDQNAKAAAYIFKKQGWGAWPKSMEKITKGAKDDKPKSKKKPSEMTNQEILEALK